MRLAENKSWTYQTDGLLIESATPNAPSGGIADRNLLRIRTNYDTTPLDHFSVKGNGNVGIGTTAPGAKLHVSETGMTTSGTVAVFGAPNLLNGNRNALFVGRNYGTAYDSSYIGYTPSATANQSLMSLGFFGSNNLVNIRADGNVGIGTTSPQYLLAVNGTMGAKEVIVTNTGWADHVLRPGYRLQPLSEVSTYIQAHHHLPDIPSEAEVKEKGVSVGDMQAKLLAKVEELTLHMIRQEQENQVLRDRLAQLEARSEAGRGSLEPRTRRRTRNP